MRDEEQAFYIRGVQKLIELEIPFLIGGGYMLERYTGISRATKDLDIHVRRSDVKRILDFLSASGFHTELTFPHWLGKVLEGKYQVDVIFSSGNGICEVDDIWFKYSDPGEIWGQPVRFSPPEESIWSKSFVMERERYDGADVAHLLHACARRIDWLRLLWRFDKHWRVLLSHLILFGFIYPAERSLVPHWIMQDLLARLQKETRNPLAEANICQGTLFSRAQYLVDVEDWKYRDARLFPSGRMTAEDIAQWTAAARQAG